MTLDAMHWVWTSSQSKGNTRLALLYAADQVRTEACEVLLGQRELMGALNTRSKDTVTAALKVAAELGELTIVTPAKGRRPALYRLPKAVGYVRPATACAPDSGAQQGAAENRSAPDSGAQSSASAPESGAQETRCAPKTGAPPQQDVVEEGTQPQQAPSRDAFAACQPLIEALTAAGITVSWGMPPADLRTVAAAVARAGVPAMVRFALDTQRTRKDRILYAKYFVRGWSGLPPAARAAPSQPAAGPAPHCGHPDCDPVTRTRETEDDRGIRSLTRCPACNPNAQRGHAA
ncbi:hypothetical protein ACFT3N_00540 [Streptomyces albidoflavus]